MIIDLKNKKLERIKPEEEIKFDFLNQICTMINNQVKLSFKIEVISINISTNKFFVKYKIDNDYFEMDLKII